MFGLPFEHDTGGIFQIVNTLPGLLKELNTIWQAVNCQH